jgi:hypothetical protein
MYRWGRVNRRIYMVVHSSVNQRMYRWGPMNVQILYPRRHPHSLVPTQTREKCEPTATRPPLSRPCHSKAARCRGPLITSYRPPLGNRPPPDLIELPTRRPARRSYSSPWPTRWPTHRLHPAAHRTGSAPLQEVLARVHHRLTSAQVHRSTPPVLPPPCSQKAATTASPFDEGVAPI